MFLVTTWNIEIYAHVKYLGGYHIPKIWEAAHYTANLQHEISMLRKDAVYSISSFQMQLPNHAHTAHLRFSNWSDILRNITMITMRVKSRSKTCLQVSLTHFTVDFEDMYIDWDSYSVIASLRNRTFCINQNQSFNLIDPAAIYMARLVLMQFITGNGTLLVNFNPFIPFNSLLPKNYRNERTKVECCDEQMALYYLLFAKRDASWHDDERLCNSIGGKLPIFTTQEELSFVESILLGPRYDPNLVPLPSPFRFYPGSGAYLGQVELGSFTSLIMII